MVLKMKSLKKLLFFTAYSLLTIGFTQVVLSTKAHAAPLASSSDPGIRSLYIKLSEYPMIDSNWPTRNQNGCGGSANKLKVFPWLGQYQDNNENQPGTGDFIDEAGDCSNKYVDGGTNIAPLYTNPLAGPWISPVALGAWANGDGMGPNWKTPVDTQAGGCPTDSDVVVRTFGDYDVKHIWGECDIDMDKQDLRLFERVNPPKAFNDDGRHLYSNGTTLLNQTFNVTQEQYNSLVNGSYQLDFITQADDWFAVYINGVFLGGSRKTAEDTLLTKLDASQIHVGPNKLAVQVIDKAVWVDDFDTGSHQWRDAGIAYQLNLTPSAGNSYDLSPDYGIDLTSRTVNFSVNNRGAGESYSDTAGGAPNGVTVKRFVKINGFDYDITPDEINQKIPGKGTKQYPITIPTSVTLAPGDEVCAYISVTPAAGITGGAVSAPEAHKGSMTSPTCITVSSKPYFRAYGNDVIVGRKFTNSTITPPCNGERLGNQYIRAYTTESGAGAGVQFAASATGIISGFMSASMHSGSLGGDEIPKPDSGLTFSNVDQNNLVGNDGSAYAGCMGDYNALAEKLLNGRAWKGNTTINSVDDLENNMLFVEGSLTINGDIDPPGNTTYSKLSDVKINLIIVKGNIFINPNVNRIDALLVALPDSGGNNGIINTCGNSNTPDLLTCKSKSLTINGAVMAKKVLFNRLKGDLASSSNNEQYNDIRDNIAEKFIFTPDFFLGLLNNAPPEVGSYKYDSISSLPPTF